MYRPKRVTIKFATLVPLYCQVSGCIYRQNKDSERYRPLSILRHPRTGEGEGTLVSLISWPNAPLHTASQAPVTPPGRRNAGKSIAPVTLRVELRYTLGKHFSTAVQTNTNGIVRSARSIIC